MHTNDKVNEKKEGKEKSQAKFLGVNPFRQFGKDSVSQKLRITVSAEGKRTVMWDRQAKQVAEVGISKQNLGQAVSKPNTLVRVGVEDLFSGPSQFEWGESSNPVIKPKQIWVPKKKGAEKVNGGPLEAKDMARSLSNVNDAVEEIDISRALSVDFTAAIHVFSQELKFLMCRSTREGEDNHFRVEYYVGINLGVSRGVAGDWGFWPGKFSYGCIIGRFNYGKDRWFG